MKNNLRISYKIIYCIIYVYIFLPLVIFLVTWTKFYIGIPISGIVVFGAIRMAKSQFAEAEGQYLEIKPIALAVVLSLLFIIALTAGWGGVLSATS